MGGMGGDMRRGMGIMGGRGDMMDDRAGGARGALLDEEELDLLMAQMATGGIGSRGGMGGRRGGRRPRF